MAFTTIVSIFSIRKVVQLVLTTKPGWFATGLKYTSNTNAQHNADLERKQMQYCRFFA